MKKLILIFSLVFSVFACLMISTRLPFRVGYEYTLAYDMIKTKHWCTLPSVAGFANFDGVHYLNIAQRGYIEEGRFFPVYPVLIKLVAEVISLFTPHHCDYFLAGWLISILSLVGTVMFFRKLLIYDYEVSEVKFATLWLLLFPISFFLYSLYTESLFLMLTLLAFYAARKQRWYWAAFCVLLLSVTRIVGVVVAIGLLTEYFVQNKIRLTNLKLKASQVIKDWKILSALIGSSFPLVIYAYFNQLKWGDWFYFLHSHATLGNSRSDSSLVFFPQTIIRYIKILVSLSQQQHEWWVALLELFIFSMVFSLLVVAWRRRVRRSFLIYAWLVFLIPASSGTFTGLPRYALLAFPIFIVLGMIKNRYLQYGLLVLSFAVQLVLLSLFSRGFYIA